MNKCPYCTMPLNDLSADGLYRASFNYNGREFSTIDSLEGVRDWMARFVRLLMPEHVKRCHPARAAPDRQVAPVGIGREPMTDSDRCEPKGDGP